MNEKYTEPSSKIYTIPVSDILEFLESKGFQRTNYDLKSITPSNPVWGLASIPYDSSAPSDLVFEFKRCEG